VSLRSERQLLVTADVVHNSPSLVTLMMVVAIGSSETTFLTSAAWRNIPEDGVLHTHRCKTPKSYVIRQSCGSG
jgi:hypothetical protein